MSVILATPIIGIDLIIDGHGVPCPYNVCTVFNKNNPFSRSLHCLLIPFSVRSTPVGTRRAVSVMHAAPIIGIDFIIDEDVSKFNF